MEIIKEYQTDVVIVGAGPAGAMLAMLLAKRNISVILIERSASLNREFRGESISPDTLALFEEYNIMPAIHAHGYLTTKKMQVFEKSKCLLEVDFEKFNFPYQFTIDLPQPVLISALLEQASQYKNFIYLNSTSCYSLDFHRHSISGIYCKRNDMKIKISSRLVVGADGRYGKIRKYAGLNAHIQPVSRDILWFMVPRPKEWGEVARLYIDKNQHIIALPTYPDQLRVGLNIKSGQYHIIRKNPISHFYQLIENFSHEISKAAKEKIKNWSDLTLLDIFTMEVPQKTINGLILIGDASHTLTPILGQGVNQAIKDSVFLAPVIEQSLVKFSHVLPQSSFKNFLKIRKKEVKSIHAFQMRQEKMLAQSSKIGISIRRILYQIMHHSFFLQKKLWGKILYNYQIDKMKNKNMI